MSGINRPPTKYTKDTPWMDDPEWQILNRTYHSTVDVMSRNHAMERMQTIEQEYMRGERVALNSGKPTSLLLPTSDTRTMYVKLSDLGVVADAMADYALKQKMAMVGERPLEHAVYNACWSNYQASQRVLLMAEHLIEQQYSNNMEAPTRADT